MQTIVFVRNVSVIMRAVNVYFGNAEKAQDQYYKLTKYTYSPEYIYDPK